MIPAVSAVGTEIKAPYFGSMIPTNKNEIVEAITLGMAKPI